MIDKLLNDYIIDPENPEKNFNIAREYDRIGQTAAAISFYLRASERTQDDDLAYDCLVLIGHCFERQKNRDYTVKSMYSSAISLIPSRPEAYYFLSRKQEQEKNYFESYTTSEIGLKFAKEIEYRDHDIGYSGIWQLYFQKAVAAWWRGRGMECRELFQMLLDDYWSEIDDNHKDSIEKNIVNLGSGPEEYAFRMYDHKMYDKLRFKFNGSREIKKNFSQVYQDLFVLSMLNGKKNGTFLEIGGADPYKGNNTYLLESQYNWSGSTIEYDKEMAETYKRSRHTIVHHKNALEIDYSDLLKKDFDTKIIDYLQLDIEPAKNTYECMLRIPFDEYKFRVITYEHDYYADVTRSFREKSRDFLKSKGYVLVVNDVSPDGICTFEDWWVHPDLVDSNILNKMKDVSDKVKQATDYMFIEKQVESFSVNHSHREKKRAFIVDDFYEDPVSVRNFAMQQEYVDGGLGRGFIGKRTKDQFLFEGVKEAFEEILNKKITKWEEHGMNGRFQLNISGEPIVYHCDNQRYAAMIYLTPEAPVSCGTSTFRHIRTKIHHNSDPEITSAFNYKTFLDKTPYETVDKFGNIFNRLVIFDAGCIHGASEYFGHDFEDARLWHMFFFDAE